MSFFNVLNNLYDWLEHLVPLWGTASGSYTEYTEMFVTDRCWMDLFVKTLQELKLKGRVKTSSERDKAKAEERPGRKRKAVSSTRLNGKPPCNSAEVRHWALLKKVQYFYTLYNYLKNVKWYLYLLPRGYTEHAHALAKPHCHGTFLFVRLFYPIF